MCVHGPFQCVHNWDDVDKLFTLMHAACVMWCKCGIKCHMECVCYLVCTCNITIIIRLLHAHACSPILACISCLATWANKPYKIISIDLANGERAPPTSTHRPCWRCTQGHLHLYQLLLAFTLPDSFCN